MPLHMPEHHKVGEQDKHGAALILEDEVGRRVSLYVHAAALRRVGQATGYDANAIDADQKGYLLILLDHILAEASGYYDKLPLPKPPNLEIGRDGTWHRA